MPTYISALTLNGVPQIDLRQDTIDENTAAEGATGHKNDGSPFTGEITTRTASDLTVSGATVTAPAGVYGSAASKSVASGTEGTPTATKGTVSNHSVTITPSVTNTAGYIAGGTKTGTGVSVAASELVSGTLYCDDAGSWNVTNIETFVVDAGTVSNPTATKGTVSNHSVTVTPSVTHSEGYIASGTKTGTGVSVSASELVSGNLPISQNGNNIDVTNYETVSVNVAASGASFATATMTNSSNQAQSISFTLTAGRTVKACFVRLTSQIARNSSSRYYYVYDMRWDGSSTGGVAGNTFYMYNGTLTNVTSGYSHSQSGTTFTLSTTGTRSTSPGSFYNGTYELVYVY